MNARIGSSKHETYRQIRDFAEDRRDWIRQLLSDPDCPVNYKLVGVAIAMRMNHRSEESFPSTKLLALDTCLSLRTVSRAINHLENGYLDIRRRKRAGNRYSLILPWANK